MSFNVINKYTEQSFNDNVSSPAPIPGLLINPATNPTYMLDIALTRKHTNGLLIGKEDNNFRLLTNSYLTNLTFMKKQSSGKIIYSAGAVIGRLNADFTVDTTWNVGGAGLGGSFIGVSTMYIQPDDKIVIGVTRLGAGTYNGVSAVPILRLNADGSLDTSFQTNLGTGPGGTITNNYAHLQPDGKIIIGSSSMTSWNSVTRPGLTRLNSDGTEDTAFVTNIGTGFTSGGNPVVGLVTSANIILLTGTFAAWKGVTVNNILALNLDGTNATTFQTNLGTGVLSGGGGSLGTSLTQQGTQIIVGGTFTSFKGNTRNGMFRLNSDGTEDTVFATNLGTGFINPGDLTARIISNQSVFIQPDGKILVGTTAFYLNGTYIGGLVRLLSTGVIDSSDSFNITYLNPGFQASNTLANGSGVSMVFYTPTGVVVSGAVFTLNGVALTTAKIVNTVQDSYYSSITTFNGRYIADAPITWVLQSSITGDLAATSGVVFSQDVTGQINFTSSNLPGTSPVNKFRWRLKLL